MYEKEIEKKTVYSQYIGAIECDMAEIMPEIRIEHEVQRKGWVNKLQFYCKWTTMHHTVSVL